ncbi:methionyl-tRNA formyltransferase [Algoriphagus locisalis]|uniref:Methionyl-tRNA formyltransferase n=1 Tax=Algoriphagus locisalis TaxID=305507 RepID=A0A1I6XSI5_9BACT|nr:formyltransferase family protein [Algoriphagus locisalis]SFT41026.1 methionyl-tRNA formyltransferase [Algoriphagus locisalis]
MITIFTLGSKGFKAISSLPSTLLNLIDAIVVGKDENVENDFSEDLKKWCLATGKKCIERKAFNPATCSSQYWILMGWRWLIPVDETRKVIVFHDSLLPKYRGFNPLVTALIEGDSEIGVTSLLASEKMDEGDILSQLKLNITYPIRIAEAIAEISNLYSALLFKTITDISENFLISTPQNHAQASYSLWRGNEDYVIKWEEDSERILRMIHASGTPYAGARTNLDGKKIRILDAYCFPDVTIVNRTPGKAIWKDKGNLVVVCGKGLLAIANAQDENGQQMQFSRLRYNFH